MLIIIFFILGLIVGSFLNVVVYRLNVAETMVAGRSKCPHCQRPIVWYDNIPLLSFILLKFRCRNCKQKISWQYPLVELSTGLFFLLIGAFHFNLSDPLSWMVTLYYLGIASFLIVIFVYDLLYMEIPGIVLWVAVAWTVAFCLFLDYQSVTLRNDIFNSLVFSGTLAAFLAFLFFFAMVAISKEKWMGMGDAYLVILLGFVLGWPRIVLALISAFTIGSIVGIVLILLKKKGMKSQIPFAPFLIAGTAIALFFFEPIADWYVNLLSF